MNSSMKKYGMDPSPAAQQAPAVRNGGDKTQSKPVRYIVPGIYMTPYGDRRDGCLKAIS